MVADIELLAMAVCNPGRLTLGPTTTTGGFPYGGLSLGFHRGMEYKISVEYQLKGVLGEGVSGLTVKGE